MFQPDKSPIKAISLWSLANIFFAFQFILRLAPGILREEMMIKFNIDAAEFSSIAGYYYLGYAAMQIPLGIMLDRLSFRFVTSSSIFIATIGVWLFVAGDSWNIILLGRFLIGAGSGIAFLAVAKIIKLYFTEKSQSMLIGFSFTFGLIGALYGVNPMKLLFDEYGYDQTFQALTIVCFSIGMLMLLFGRTENNAHNSNEHNYLTIAKEVFSLIINPRILLICISGGLLVGSLEGFADVWSMPYFEQILGLSDQESRIVTSKVYLGMCFGGPILASFARMIRSEVLTIFLTGTATTILFIILFLLEEINFYPASIMMFVLGILCCYQVLVFSVVTKTVSQNLAGLAIAITNSVNMAFGSFFHKYIGHTITENWNGAINALGNPIYTKELFISALICIPVGCALGQIGFMMLGFINRNNQSKNYHNIANS